jgi:hypothetical protein
MQDQMLRAKGVGDSKLTNPYAHQTRVMWSSAYYQFKPDYFFWTIFVLLRKFGIAAVTALANPAGLQVKYPHTVYEHELPLFGSADGQLCNRAILRYHDAPNVYPLHGSCRLRYSILNDLLMYIVIASRSGADAVLRSHTESKYTSALHNRISTAIQGELRHSERHV